MTAPALEPPERPADRFGDAAVTAGIAQRAAAGQSLESWNAWWLKSWESRVPQLCDIMGRALGEVQAEIEAEAAARLETLKSEIVRAVGESLARQQHQFERELALLRAEISRLKGIGDDRT